MARILVVDDDQSILRLLRRVLEAEGHEVTAADTSAGAIALVGAGAGFDLLVLDFWIGSGTGLDVMAALGGGTATMPVLFLSGGDPSLSLEATAALAEMRGASEFLCKPVEARQLLAAIGKLI